LIDWFTGWCRLANEFLKNLALQNSGRYLCLSARYASDGAFDAHLFAHQLIQNDFADPLVLDSAFTVECIQLWSKIEVNLDNSVSDQTIVMYLHTHYSLIPRD